MSTTSESDRAAVARAASRNGGTGASGGAGLSSASPRDTAQILLLGIVPALVRGLFSPRRTAMRLLTRLDTDARAVQALRAIRARHDGEGVTLLGGRMAVLWGPEAIRDALDRSADTYASDAGAKAKGMSHFQPDALTLSRGEAWRDRRAFTEAVLGSHERAHPLGARFLRVVAEEVAAELPERGRLEWSDWERCFDRITLRVIFGDRARGEQELTTRLERLMGQANRLVGLSHGDDYFELYRGLERHLREPDPESLLGLAAAAPHSDLTRITQQVPHWMFAMRDTLAMNALRALAVIVSDGAIRARAEAELSATDLADPGGVMDMAFLAGCLHEAMRLWPTTPLIARETTRPTTLAGERLEEGAQVMMLNVFNHRDPDHVEDADRFVPERWQRGGPDYRFNHLSNGTQDCPGGPLVLLLGCAVIGRVLERYQLELTHPRLDPAAGLPHMLDFFALRFSARPRPR